MATLGQIEANRLNAQKSTGPRTPRGKAVSSQNAFKSGLDADSQFCYGERPADFYRLQVEYFARFQPRSPEERFQVDSLIRNEWMLRRLFRAEAHLWEFHTTRASRFDGVPLGEAFHNAHSEFMRLHRRITLFEKSYKESFDQLKQLQEARLAAQAQIADMAASDGASQPVENKPCSSEIGFVPELWVGPAPIDPLADLSDSAAPDELPHPPDCEAANPGGSGRSGKPSHWQPRASTVSPPAADPVSAALLDRA